jgi:nucleoside-diphosphate-sugar epimerase
VRDKKIHELCMNPYDLIINFDDPILVTGSNGFIGTRVVETLLEYGFNNLRCFVRPSSNMATLNKVRKSYNRANIEILRGNLLSRDDCIKASKDVFVIIHLAAGIGKSFPGCFLNSVVSTRNLLDSTLKDNSLKRFVNVSSFAVYSNMRMKRGALLDETCEVESQPEKRGEAYCYGKVKQDEMVLEYNMKYNIPYVIMRPGAVYGPGKELTGRVGIGTFGIFLHLGGSNKIPLTYVDNCADALVLAGIKKNVDGEIFNIVDDNLPTSRKFLMMYKKNVGYFKSIYIPYRMFYFLCFLWEKYSDWSEGQLPPYFNRKMCSANWKGNQYSNKKLKKLLEWKPKASFDEASKRYFEQFKKTEGSDD